ncbi:MAG: hypothetical protein V3R98_11360 [Alphaproteobacteria bacterium]
MSEKQDRLETVERRVQDLETRLKAVESRVRAPVSDSAPSDVVDTLRRRGEQVAELIRRNPLMAIALTVIATALIFAILT